jgi:4-hydroxy-4-methyl-2-oxoglutarate aldolase
MTLYSGQIDEFLEHGTSTLYEASGLPCMLDHAIRPVWHGAAVAGPAFPVLCAPGDNLAIHVALDVAPRGHVLVVNAAGFVAGYFGEVMTVAAEARGVDCLVIDGGARDIAALERRKFPVFARGVSMRGTVKYHVPSVGEPIIMAGVQVALGDLIVADADGVIALPQPEVERVLAAARARTEKEARSMQRLQAGETSLEILGLTAHRRKPRG